MFKLKVSIFVSGESVEHILRMCRLNDVKFSSIENGKIELSNSTTVNQLRGIETFFGKSFEECSTSFEDKHICIDAS